MRSLQRWLMGKRNSFRIGEWSVEPLLDRISRSGESVDLQPQVMEVLVYLADNAGEVVSSEEITSRVWRGRVVTHSSIYVTINQLRHALGDDAKNPRYIETVPKRGYRLTAEVCHLDEGAPPPSPAAVSGGLRNPRVRWGAGMLVILALGVAIAVFWQGRGTLQTPSGETYASVPPQSVAVLPFVDMSPEQDQQWLADGISEEIINRLAQVPELKVTGRTSSFSFRGPQDDTPQIGQALGVAHLLEGSIRTEGERVRVTAQLLRANDGFHVWSENFEGETSEIFSIQDEIASIIARSLQPKLASSGDTGSIEALQPIYPKFDAYELYLKALEQINLNTRQSLIAAQNLLERSLALEPDYVDAHVAMANVYGKFVRVGIFDGHPHESHLEAATPHVERALEIDPDHAGANAALGALLGPGEKRRKAYQRALELNPNMHHVYLDLGTTKLDELVSWRETLPLMERAAEIEPLDVETALMLILFMQRVPHRWDEAEAMLERLAQAHPDRTDVKEGQGFWWLMVRGRPSQAVPIFEQALLLDPDRIWVKIFLARCWYMVGEFERAEELQSQSMQWTAVFDRDREQALREVKAVRDWPENYDFGRRILMAYTLVMLRDFQAAVDVLAADSGNPEEFTRIYGQQFGMHNDPGMSLAAAQWALGNQAEYEQWAEFAKNAINIRTENGRLHNFEYSMATARLKAMEGRHYDAALELEWFVRNGPLDIRELMYPAYDGMRDSPRFYELKRLQLERVNAEREELGLDPHLDYSALVNYVDQLGDSFAPYQGAETEKIRGE